MTSNCSRSGTPILPYLTSPTWSPMPSARGSRPAPARSALKRSRSCLARRAAAIAAAQASCPGGVVVDREDAEHRIADELHHPPAFRQHGAGAAFEIAVEQGEEGIDRHRLGQPGGIAQIAVPQHRGHGAAVAALDLAAQHRLARLAAEIGRQHVVGDLVLDRHLAGDREPALDAQQRADVVVAEAGLRDRWSRSPGCRRRPRSTNGPMKPR